MAHSNSDSAMPITTPVIGGAPWVEVRGADPTAAGTFNIILLLRPIVASYRMFNMYVRY